MHHPSVVTRVAFPIAIVILCSAGSCGGDKVTAPSATVASVQLTVVPTNPRVNETASIGATPVTSGGVAVPGVACTITSSSSAVLALTVSGNNAVGLGVSPGTAVVTATCAGKQNTVSITVRPITVTFTVNKAGAGSGSVFLNPPGGTYDRGTSVTATATPLAGSSFTGWSGACTGTSATCTLTLLADAVATATFGLAAENFVGTTVPVTAMGSITGGAGCVYAITTGGSFSMSVTTNPDGSLGGTATGVANTGIAVTFTPAFTTCTANPFSNNLTGPVSGSNAAMVGVAATTSGGQSFTFNGTRNGTTATGTLTIKTTTSDGITNFVLTKVVSPYVLTKQ